MKFLGVIVSIVIILVLLFVGLLYFTLKTKTKTVTEEAPYVSYMNTDLVLARDVILVKNDPAFVFEEALKLVEDDVPLFDGVTQEHFLKAGSNIQLHDAKLFTNGVSGFTQSIVFGTVATEAGEFGFEYAWGDEHSTLSNEIPNYFTFDEPVWEVVDLDTIKEYVF